MRPEKALYLATARQYQLPRLSFFGTQPIPLMSRLNAKHLAHSTWIRRLTYLALRTVALNLFVGLGVCCASDIERHPLRWCFLLCLLRPQFSVLVEGVEMLRVLSSNGKLRGEGPVLCLSCRVFV
jgi:hypothetical protein